MFTFDGQVEVVLTYQSEDRPTFSPQVNFGERSK